MKSNVRLLLALLLAGFFSSCHHDSDSTNCPGTLVATWKENGNAMTSNVVLYVHGSTMFNLTFTACVSDRNDRTCSLALLPYPPVPGTYPLKYPANSGIPWNGYGQGIYTDETLGDFTTDTATHIGFITIATVDTVNKRLSGSFAFEAVSTTGSGAVSITDGQLINVKYSN